MQININNLNKSFSLIVKQDDTIYSIKMKIQKKININVSNQKLIYNNKIMEDGKTLSDYGINEESKLCFFLTFLLPIELTIENPLLGSYKIKSKL